MFVDQAAAHEIITRHYVLLAFALSLGAVQVAVSVSGLRGLWLLPSAKATRWLGICLSAASVALFFLAPVWVEGPWASGSVGADSSTRGWGTASWGELAGAYNINDVDGGLSGTAQAIWFPAGFAGALLLTLAVGSVFARLRRPAGRSAGPEDGLEGLRTRGYPAVLGRSLAALRATGFSEAKAEFDRFRYPYGLLPFLLSKASSSGKLRLASPDKPGPEPPDTPGDKALRQAQDKPFDRPRTASSTGSGQAGPGQDDERV